MARKPEKFQWVGFTEEQRGLLDFLDHLGNNGWARNPQSDALMPQLLGQCADAGLRLDRIKVAMLSIGYSERNMRMLDRWERKRTTGRFAPIAD